MKKIFSITISLFLCFSLLAQDDLLKMMEQESPTKPSVVYATFKSTRVINLQSNETMKAKHLDFRIQHRFGSVNMTKDNVYGLYDLFGMDLAKMRLSFDYGITDRLMVGAGRTYGQYDFNLKFKILQQKTKGKGSSPISVDYFGAMGIDTKTFTDPSRDNFFTSRLAFVNQLIISRKFNEWISFELAPSMVHHNLVAFSSTPNDIYALGIGASFKITRSTRFNVEYIPRFNFGGARNAPLDALGTIAYDEFAIGFDIETGGHVFQLHLTNAQGLIEQQFITENTSPLVLNKYQLNTLRLGFNLSRTFSFDNSAKKKAW